MKKISILDCTLNNGGVLTDWYFGHQNINIIVQALDQANIDIIELGRLDNNHLTDINYTVFNQIEETIPLIQKTSKSCFKVISLNAENYDVKSLPNVEISTLDGIRYTFTKNQLKRAIKDCEIISNKGYRIFLQPLITSEYSDQEYIKMIMEVNALNLYAFYIVDSFGQMHQEDLLRYFYMADFNLNKYTIVGFQPFNNLQMAFTNARSLLDTNTHRDLIIDTCLYGMGMGAGNLNTELFVDYLNLRQKKNYISDPLLNAIDFAIKPLHDEKFWGFSLPFYLSAIYGTHPSYAEYLDSLGKLTVKEISKILKGIIKKKRNRFDYDYIKNFYLQFQLIRKGENDDRINLTSVFSQKNVLLIAPGSSVRTFTPIINEFIERENVIVVSSNFIPKNFRLDYAFYSNIRRYQKSVNNLHCPVIFSSNIITYKTKGYFIDYRELINTTDAVEDNSGLMLIKMMVNFGVKKIYLAGYDGYSVEEDINSNFVDENLAFYLSRERLEKVNRGMKLVLKQYSNLTQIEFLTPQRNITI
jgi:4-hydroxy 2-oxovalerate aldolase